MDVISTKGAPAAVGPYAQGVRTGGLVFVSGQIGLDPGAGTMVAGGVEAETRRALANLSAVLEAAGSGLPRIVRATVYLLDMRDFAAMNAIYAEAFGPHRPARACVEVSGLPKGARVEIDAIAEVG